MSHPPIRAVLFDYGLVLSGPPDPVAWARLKHLLGANEKDFYAAYWDARDDYDRGALNSETYWHTVAAALQRKVDPSLVRDLVSADVDLWTQPNQAMIDWAAALHRSGIKTGLLSNIGDAMEIGILERCSWLREFAHHTFSHRLGIAKPALEIYRHAADGLGVAPEEVLFVDDREENIAAARQAGMNAILYGDHAAFVTAMKDAGFGDLLLSIESKS
jgi:putative hydrolase of the HAD superfamily